MVVPGGRRKLAAGPPHAAVLVQHQSVVGELLFEALHPARDLAQRRLRLQQLALGGEERRLAVPAGRRQLALGLLHLGEGGVRGRDRLFGRAARALDVRDLLAEVAQRQLEVLELAPHRERLLAPRGQPLAAAGAAPPSAVACRPRTAARSPSAVASADAACATCSPAASRSPLTASERSRRRSIAVASVASCARRCSIASNACRGRSRLGLRLGRGQRRVHEPQIARHGDQPPPQPGDRALVLAARGLRRVDRTSRGRQRVERVGHGVVEALHARRGRVLRPLGRLDRLGQRLRLVLHHELLGRGPARAAVERAVRAHQQSVARHHGAQARVRRS